MAHITNSETYMQAPFALSFVKWLEMIRLEHCITAFAAMACCVTGMVAHRSGLGSL